MDSAGGALRHGLRVTKPNPASRRARCLCVGSVLSPDEVAFACLQPLLQGEVDNFEVAPETTWFPRPERPRPFVRPTGYGAVARACPTAT